MKLKLRIFGQLAHEMGNNEIVVDQVFTTKELSVRLQALHPVFSRIPFKVAVNHTIVSDDFVFQKDDEIAIMPPFSGG